MRTALFLSAMIIGEAIVKAAGKFEPLGKEHLSTIGILVIAFFVADIVELFK